MALVPMVIEQTPRGERAFEIVLARQIASREAETTWFERHGSTPISELPAHWPDDYKALVQKRIALIETDRITLLSGVPEPVAMGTDSGRPHDIYRCPSCRVALCSDYGRRAMRFVRVGTLDDPDRLPPDIHIYTASKQPWVKLSPEIPAVAEYYKREDHWPAESLNRRRAVLEQTAAAAAA
jgi:hypothetical protein